MCEQVWLCGNEISEEDQGHRCSDCNGHVESAQLDYYQERIVLPKSFMENNEDKSVKYQYKFLMA